MDFHNKPPRGGTPRHEAECCTDCKFLTTESYVTENQLKLLCNCSVLLNILLYPAQDYLCRGETNQKRWTSP